MRVLHINCNYTSSNLHQKLIDALNKIGILNRVVIPRYYGAPSRAETNEEEKVLECFRKNDRFLFFLKQRKINQAVKKAIDPERFDIIHAYTLFTDGNCARNLSLEYGIPYVVAIRNTDVNAFFRWRILLRPRGVQIMKDASSVFFLSDAYRKTVFEKYIPKELIGLISSKSKVIPNGIDEFWLKNRPNREVFALRIKQIRSQEIRLVYAGRIDKNKNIPTIQQAACLLREKGYRVSLTVIGRVEDSSEYERILSQPHTTVKEEQPKEQLINEYRDHSIFVMPSFHESFGLVYAEAISQGLPVVYSKGQGFDSQFEDGVVGYSACSHSAEDVARAILQIVEAYEEFPERCIECAAVFNWACIAEEYNSVYHSILLQLKP